MLLEYDVKELSEHIKILGVQTLKHFYTHFNTLTLKMHVNALKLCIHNIKHVLVTEFFKMPHHVITTVCDIKVYKIKIKPDNFF